LQNNTKYFLLTVDVEDWFQVENFKPWIPFSTWDQRELRVERNVHRLLDLFDSVKVSGNQNSSEASETQRTTPNQQHTTHNQQHTTYYKHTKKVRCTFFVLGWLADRLPKLVREIQNRGHEVASHGCIHQLPDLLSADALKQDLTDSKKLLEDITGAEVVGYRAPSFSINNDILKTIQDSGYRYDSSYNSFSLHGRYGKISLNGTGKKGIAHKISQYFYELPISNLSIKNPLSFDLSAFSSGRNKKKRIVLPWGGGAYFRLIPLSLFKSGIKKNLRHQDAYVFYAHPWEFDPEQPRVNQAAFNFKFRHYTNLNKSQAKLRSLIESFDHCWFLTCSRYLELNGGL
jgi:polysaccharide deacetylase family protein (PEP-CTERM system associated)